MPTPKPYRSPAQLVAEACSDNHVALLIPCHRVIRSDGSIGGYRWGAERKRALLAREVPSGRHGSKSRDVGPVPRI